MPDSKPLSRTGASVSVGTRWRNLHTGRETTVLVVEPPRKTDLSNDALMVRHEGGAPPGFDDRRFGGSIITSWLQHWEEIS